MAARMNAANEFLYDFTLDEMLVEDHQSILEIGFGNGVFFEKQLKRASQLQLSGIDCSEDMIQAASSINRQLIEDGHLTLHKCSSHKMPFADASFDNVFSVNVAYFWTDPAAHVEEIARILKPGGRFYTTIRTPESLDSLPFTKWGFRRFTAEEWKLICHQHHLSFLHASLVNEPFVKGAMAAPGLQSVCLVAEKISL